MNLMDKLLDYKHIIGQVVLDKNPALRTVVNKVGQIEATGVSGIRIVIDGVVSSGYNEKNSGLVCRRQFFIDFEIEFVCLDRSSFRLHRLKCFVLLDRGVLYPPTSGTHIPD